MIEKLLKNSDEFVIKINDKLDVKDLKFINYGLGDETAVEANGKKCFEVLFERKERCEKCPIIDNDSIDKTFFYCKTTEFKNNIFNYKVVPQEFKDSKPTDYVVIISAATKSFKTLEEHKQEVFLREASALANLGYWEHDIQNNVLLWSDEVYSIFNIDKNTKVSFERFIDFVHEDDRDFVWESYSESITLKKPYEVMHRIVLNDGRIRYLNKKCKSFYNAKGEAIRTLGTVMDITDKVVAEKIAVRDKSIYKLIFEMSNDGIGILDKKGVFIDLNNSLQKMLKYDRNELIGETIKVILINENESFLDKKKILHQIRKNGFSKTYEKKYKTKNGELLYAKTTVYELEDEMFGESRVYYWINLKDVTNIKKTEETLIQNKNELDEIFYNSPFAMVLLEKNLTIIKSNKLADEVFDKVAKNPIPTYPRNYFNCNESFIRGGKCGTGKTCKSCPIRKEVIKTIMDKKNHHSRNVLFKIVKGEETKNLYLNISTAFLNGADSTKILLCIEDVSDIVIKRRVEEELHLIKKSNKIKQQFLANMSHEIRTPMTGILGLIDFLMETPLEKKQLDYLKTIRSSSKSMLNILNDTLLLSKIESGKLQLYPENLYIDKLVKELKLLFGSLTKQKGLKYFFSIADNFPKVIFVDVNRIKQVLTNLISNAIKFTDTGSVHVKFELLNISGSELKIKISVADTGIGIKKEDQKGLFDSFSQVDSSYTRNYGGIGLGLSICNNLVNMMNGEIGVKSEFANGSTFWVTLQVGLGIENIEEAKCEGFLKVNNNLGLKVLIAEDVFVNQKVVQMILESFGCEPTIVNNGKDALEIAQSKDFDIILMDIQMPVMDGIQAMKAIRRTITKPPPIIGLSANSLEGDYEKFIKEGLDDYITKPIDRNLLFEKLSKWTRKMSD